MSKDNIKKLDTDIYKASLSMAIQHKLNISDSDRDKIINYIKLISKGPEDICDVLKEIPLNFKGDQKYFAVYIITLFVANYFEKIKKRKREEFVDNISNDVAECFGLDLDNLTKILLEKFGKESLEKIISGEAFINIINGSFTEHEKFALILLYYFATLSAFDSYGHDIKPGKFS